MEASCYAVVMRLDRLYVLRNDRSKIESSNSWQTQLLVLFASLSAAVFPGPGIRTILSKCILMSAERRREPATVELVSSLLFAHVPQPAQRRSPSTPRFQQPHGSVSSCQQSKSWCTKNNSNNIRFIYRHTTRLQRSFIILIVMRQEFLSHHLGEPLGLASLECGVGVLFWH